MRFLVDAHLPPALARMLSGLGHDAEHVFDLGMRTADDRQIWEYAHLTNSVIITKDDDFPSRRAMTIDGPQILWIRRGNTSRRQLLLWFESLLPHIVDTLDRGDSIVEVV